MGKKSMLEHKPDKCWRCGLSDELETGLVDYDDEHLDEDLMIESGVEAIDLRFEDIAPFSYVYEFAVCHRCHKRIDYEPRWYFNTETCKYDRPRPLSPKQLAELQRLAQIAAGQLLLFDGDGGGL